LNARPRCAWSKAEGVTLEALVMCFWLRFCDQQTVRPKERAAFQIVLKRRAHMLLIASVSVQNIRQFVESLPDHPICSSEYASEALKDVYATIKRGRSGQGSLPCSTPLQSRARTSPGSPHFHRLPPGPEAGNSNRR